LADEREGGENDRVFFFTALILKMKYIFRRRKE